MPERKISETLLDFASPLLQHMPPEASSTQIKEILLLVRTVWNAIVLDSVRGDSHYLGMAMHRMKEDVLGSIMISDLIDRKRRMFGEDHRLIGDLRITKKDGELRLWAEARDPYTRENKTQTAWSKSDPVAPQVERGCSAEGDEDKMNDEPQSGFFRDNGEEINPDLIMKPSLCVTCKKDDDPDEEILCTLARADQEEGKDFQCGAFSPRR